MPLRQIALPLRRIHFKPYLFMRKFYSFLMALLTVCGMAQAQVVFDFSTDNAYELFGFTGFSSSTDNFGDFTEDGSVTSGDVTITVSPSGKSNANRMWSGSLRMYGGTLTVASNGEKITSINFVLNSSKWGDANTANVGTLGKGEWTGEAEEVVITVAANTQIKSMTVNLGGEVPTPTPTIDWTSSAEAPLTVAAVLEKAAQLQGGETSGKDVYVKGLISEITEIGTINQSTGEPYGNATYTIVDDPGTAQSLVVFRGFGLDGAKLAEGDIKVGDEVVVVGVIKNYVKDEVSTIEVNQGNKIYSLNGETAGGDTPGPQPTEGERGDGSLENPFNYLAAIKAASALEAGAKSEQDYYIAGRISQIKYTFSAQYGTATFFISDDGTTENQFQVYSTYYLGNRAWVEGDTQIAVGDTVIVCGKIMNYNGNTPETVSKESFIYSLNGVTDGGNPEPPTPGIDWTSSAEAPLTVAALIEKASKLEGGAKSDVEVFVKGIVSEMVEMSIEHGNATYYISDDGQTENQFYVYRGKGLGGENFTETDTLKVGDEVIVVGFITNYVKDEVSTLEFATGSKLYSLNGQTEPQPVEYELEGAGQLDDPYTIADIQHIGNVKENGVTGWVMGYIVGYADGSMKNSVFGVEAPEGKEVLETNILLAASADETDAANCIPVQLSKQFDMREVLSLKAVPENLGKKIWIQGEFLTYFSVPGVKNVADWSFDGQTITTAVNTLPTASSNQTIYNIAGQRVKTINRSGLYIVDGKKVVVK